MKRKYIFIALAFAQGAAFAADPMDVTIKGESKEKVTIERVAPDPEVPIKDVIPFSRLGQTEWILSEELDYVDAERQEAMMDVHSHVSLSEYSIVFSTSPWLLSSSSFLAGSRHLSINIETILYFPLSLKRSFSSSKL
jgi:hypothetical protein